VITAHGAGWGRPRRQSNRRTVVICRRGFRETPGLALRIGRDITAHHRLVKLVIRGIATVRKDSLR
jgi:hypothetical protein